MELKVNSELFFKILFWTVISNFIAQIPYYFHQYYISRHIAPSLIGLTLLSLVFVWFISAYILLKNGKKTGYYLMLTFLIIEFLFYLQTQIVQATTGHGILLHVLRPDNGLLFIVFFIGYVNFIASAYFIFYLIKYRSSFFNKLLDKRLGTQ